MTLKEYLIRTGYDDVARFNLTNLELSAMNHVTIALNILSQTRIRN